MPAQRILILDDEPNIGSSLRMILEREGYAVTVTRTIADAKAVADRADALLLDVRLPDGSGIDLLRQLRERDHPAPVIMISGHGTIRRSRGRHPRRRVRFSRKAAEPRQSAVVAQERARTGEPAPRKRTPARAGGRQDRR